MVLRFLCAIRTIYQSPSFFILRRTASTCICVLFWGYFSVTCKSSCFKFRVAIACTCRCFSWSCTCSYQAVTLKLYSKLILLTDMAREAGTAALNDAGISYQDVEAVVASYCYGEPTSGKLMTGTYMYCFA